MITCSYCSKSLDFQLDTILGLRDHPQCVSNALKAAWASAMLCNEATPDVCPCERCTALREAVK